MPLIATIPNFFPNFSLSKSKAILFIQCNVLHVQYKMNWKIIVSFKQQIIITVIRQIRYSHAFDLSNQGITFLNFESFRYQHQWRQNKRFVRC